MAKEIQTLRTCDICGTNDDVVRVRIIIDGAQRTGDLCAKHRKPLETLIAKLPAPAARGMAAIPVLSEAEWERAQRKGATKVRRATKQTGSSAQRGGPGLTGAGRGA